MPDLRYNLNRTDYLYHCKMLTNWWNSITHLDTHVSCNQNAC